MRNKPMPSVLNSILLMNLGETSKTNTLWKSHLGASYTHTCSSSFTHILSAQCIFTYLHIWNEFTYSETKRKSV